MSLLAYVRKTLGLTSGSPDAAGGTSDTTPATLLTDERLALWTRLRGLLASDTPATPDADGRAELSLDATNRALRVYQVGAATAATEATLAALKMPQGSVAVTPSDSTDLSATATKGIWVGGAGDLSIKLTNDSAATSILAVPAGTFLPGSYKRVMAATTATSIIAFS